MSWNKWLAHIFYLVQYLFIRYWIYSCYVFVIYEYHLNDWRAIMSFNLLKISHCKTRSIIFRRKLTSVNYILGFCRVTDTSFIESLAISYIGKKWMKKSISFKCVYKAFYKFNRYVKIKILVQTLKKKKKLYRIKNTK